MEESLSLAGLPGSSKWVSFKFDERIVLKNKNKILWRIIEEDTMNSGLHIRLH